MVPSHHIARLGVANVPPSCRQATFSEALFATLVGPLVFGIVLTTGYIITQRVFGALGILVFLIGFLAWIFL